MRPTSFTIRPGSTLLTEEYLGKSYMTAEHFDWMNQYIGEGLWSARWDNGLTALTGKGLVITILYPDDAMRYKLTFSEELK